ncbi:MAG TPA: radical SAM protein [Dehalococcoidia bacterium]|nr:radical SAM protein [Dehalococcoidia bacterium]
MRRSTDDAGSQGLEEYREGRAITTILTELESLYWVFTHNCNLRCAHCYNWSRPGAPTITPDQADAVLRHLPAKIRRINLSGGEPLAEAELLLRLLTELRPRYADAHIQIQTNGDLLDEAMLTKLLAAGLNHVSIASEDEWHTRSDRKFPALRDLFASQGLMEKKLGDPGTGSDRDAAIPTYSIWGATPDFWVGGVWPRGRAFKHGLAKRAPDHNFCDRWSGALGFLDNGSSQQEFAVQLTSVYACCPGTIEPLGDLAEEPLSEIVARHADSPIWQALSHGDPEAMGIADGIDRDQARERIEELGSVCLWCDEFFRDRIAHTRGADVVESLPVMGERGHPERD